jgi:hypothetical protein
MEHLPYLVFKKPDFPRGDFDAPPAFAVSPDGVGAHPENPGEFLRRHGTPEFLFQKHRLHLGRGCFLAPASYRLSVTKSKYLQIISILASASSTRMRIHSIILLQDASANFPGSLARVKKMEKNFS